VSQIVFSHPAGALTFEDSSAEPPCARWTAFSERPRALRRREFAYPGADGVEQMLLGAGAQELEMEGYLIAGSESGLAALKAAIRARADGRTGTLAVRGSAESFADVELIEARFLEHAAGEYLLESFRITWRSLGP